MIDELVAAIEEKLPDDRRRLARTAKELSLAFTSERAAREADYMSHPDKLSAYVAAFMLPGAVKVMHCLEQVGAQGDDISVLDIGSGPGTASLATSAFFSTRQPETRVRIAAMERTRPALEKAHELFRKIAPPHHSFESAVLDITKQPLGKALAKRRFDIVIAANVLNELPEDQVLKISADLIQDFLKEDGSFIIIDPALRETARPLMALRDRLVAEGAAQVAAPCLHQKACPMLAANDRDWCHFYIEWERPEYLVKLDELSGMDHRHLKMSYLILTSPLPLRERARERGDRTGHPPSNSLPSREGGLIWRVVSSPLDSKGKREVVLCGASGELKRVRRLTKDASDTNRAFNSVKRGDVVRCDPVDRIRSEDGFQILNSFL